MKDFGQALTREPITLDQAYSDATRKSMAVNTAATIIKKDARGHGDDQFTDEVIWKAREFVALVAAALVEQATGSAPAHAASPYLPSTLYPSSPTTLEVDEIREVARLASRLSRDAKLDDRDLASLDTVVRTLGSTTSDIYQHLLRS